MPTPTSIARSSLMVAISFLLASLPAQPQTPAPKPAAPPVRTRSNSTLHQPPCWQQVGIPKGAIEQRRSIEQSAHAQVESVCADSSLTPQQRHQKIKEIRQQAHQQIDAIITAQQQEELKTCNTQRAANHPAPLPHPITGGLGPCGEMAVNPAPTASEDNPPADNAPQPKRP